MANEPKSVLATMASRYGMEPDAFEATLRATVVPAKITNEQFAAFLLVCQQYSLNPILKEIHGFPAKSGGIQPIVGVDGWANLINSHPQADGFTFEDHFEHGELSSITCNMYRKDRTHPVTATEYMAECKRGTEPWEKWPRRMLRHKALIQAARYCFGFAGILDPDEWERSPENLSTTSSVRRGRGPTTVIQSASASNGSRPLPPIAGAIAESEVASAKGVRAESEDPPPPHATSPTTPPPPLSNDPQYPAPGEMVLRSTRAATQEVDEFTWQTDPPKRKPSRPLPPTVKQPAQGAQFDSALWAEGCMHALRAADDPNELEEIQHERINPHLSEASPVDIEEVMAVLKEVRIQAGLEEG